MTVPPSPSLLLPPPKRAPGVRRLNGVPVVIAVAVVSIFLAVVAYTMIQRSHKDQAAAAEQAADANKPHGSKPPAGLTGPKHGEIEATVTNQPGRFIPAAASTPLGASQQAAVPAATTPPQVQSGTDADEQARQHAWAVYYQQISQLQASRFEMEMRARQGGNDPLQSAAGGGDSQIPGRGEQGAPPESTGATPGAPQAEPYSRGGTDPAGQTGKQAFLRTPGDPYGMNEDTPGAVHGPKPNTIMEGTAVPIRLVDGATSDSPGQLVTEVTTNVYDDMTGNVLLIPQWTRVVTTYDTAVSAGQDRIGTIAQRLIFPDTSSRQIGSMQVADQAGLAGLKDLLDTHFWEKFGSALTIAIVGTGTQLAQPPPSSFSTYSPMSTAAGQMTQQLQQFGTAAAQQGLSRANTIKLRSGLRALIKFNKDLTLPPYVDHRSISAATLGPLVQ